MTASIGHHIGGKRDIGQGSRTQPVFNPATGEQTGRLSLAGKADVDRAIDSAVGAFDAWSITTPLRRARVLNKFLRILEARTAELAKCMPTPSGRSIAAWRSSSSQPAPPTFSR